ncbi:MAG: hypothetical protein L0H84_04270 [Pseudonocardia sp.]|nr:hypothetical protein [Pseudonocardia sp.]
MTTLARTLSVAALVVAAVACAAPQDPPPEPPPAAEALAAYERYWAVVDAAFAAPGARDWSARLAEVATGPALESVAGDVANYADFPAHRVGTVQRSPSVVGSDNGRVRILDCVDISGVSLVADESGAPLDDTANRVPRYRFSAEVVAYGGRWLVERTAPLLDQPC